MRYKILGLFLILTVLCVVFWKKDPETATVFRGDAVKAIYATGSVEPTVMASLSPKITARLIEIFADEGTRVKKDYLLAKLDDSQEKANLLEQEAKLILAEQEFKRIKTLREKNAISQDLYDKASSQLQATQALTKATKARLEFTKIIAPSDGLIIKRDGEVGDLLSPQDKLFWIALDETPRVTVEVDEEDISNIKIGQEVLLRSDAFSLETFNGVVSSITPKGDPITRSFRVRISIIGDTPLKFGMTIEANIICEKRTNSLLIPTSFLIDGEKVKFKNKKLKNVVVGIKGAQFTEIIDGLSEGDIIIR